MAPLANRDRVVLYPLVRTSSAGILCCAVLCFFGPPQDHRGGSRGAEKFAGGKALEALPLSLCNASRVGCGMTSAVWRHLTLIPRGVAPKRRCNCGRVRVVRVRLWRDRCRFASSRTNSKWFGPETSVQFLKGQDCASAIAV